MAAPRNGWEAASTLLPVALDLAHLAVFGAINGWLRGLLATPGAAAVAVLTGLYVAWLVTLVLVGTLESTVDPGAVELATRGADGRTTTTRAAWPKVLFFYPSLLFSLLLVILIGRATGELDAPAIAPGLQDAALALAVVLFFAHCIIAAVDVRPRHAPTSRAHLVVLVPVLVVGELMLNLATAAWLHLFAAKPGDAAAAASPGELATSPGELVVALVLFLAVFAGPRFTALARHFTWPSLVSGLAFVAWEVWQTLDEVAL